MRAGSPTQGRSPHKQAPCQAMGKEVLVRPRLAGVARDTLQSERSWGPPGFPLTEGTVPGAWYPGQHWLYGDLSHPMGAPSAELVSQGCKSDCKNCQGQHL